MTDLTPTDLAALLADLPEMRNLVTYTPEVLAQHTAWEQWIITTANRLIRALEQMVKERDRLAGHLEMVKGERDDMAVRGDRLKEERDALKAAIVEHNEVAPWSFRIKDPTVKN